MCVDPLTAQCQLDVAPDLVVSHMGGKGGRETQSGECHGGIGRIAARLDGLGMVEGYLVTEREDEPSSRSVLRGLALCPR